jgi:hypothetical protein
MGECKVEGRTGAANDARLKRDIDGTVRAGGLLPVMGAALAGRRATTAGVRSGH